MSIDLGLKGGVERIDPPMSWHVSAGSVCLTALEGGQVLHWAETHVFVMNADTGHLMIDGPLGTFCHAWPSWGRGKGVSLASFLSRLNYDYFMRKTAKQPFEEVDPRATIAHLRTEILRDRRRGFIESDHARDMWNDVADLSEHMSGEELVASMAASSSLYEAFVQGGPSVIRREAPTARRFWDEAWTTFRDQVLIPMTLEEQASRAPTDAVAA